MACTFRMSGADAAATDVSMRARECCAHFQFPYQAVLLPGYRGEVTRLRRGAMEIGCLNQPWAGPLLVWYPEGDWVSATHEGKAVINEKI